MAGSRTRSRPARPPRHSTMEPTATSAPSLPRSIEEIRGEFPILARQIHGEPLAYLDNGATAQKPLAVIDALDNYWREHNANVHRGVHTLSEEATALYEEARETIASHLGADRREVIFVRNATEALNLVAYSWGRTNLSADDRVVVTEMEHHSNVVPWYQVAQEKEAHLDWAPIDGDGRLDMDAFMALLERGPKLVAITHVSNVLGTINPIEEIARLTHDAGALLVVDGAQAGPKLELDMSELGADFYAVTGHKMYGPTGIGALFGRRELLEEMPPFIGGGSMIRKVTKELITWADLPAKFEGGTPPIGEAVGFGAAVRWIDELGLPAIHAAEAELATYALERVAEVPGLTVFGPPAGDDRGGIVSFDMDGVHAHDISEILDRHGVAVRAGHHCAQVLMQQLGVSATTRASFAVYNTRAEVDALVDGLLDVRKVFEL
jgi:cysteine desulfurase/selenocysteine lyase